MSILIEYTNWSFKKDIRPTFTFEGVNRNSSCNKLSKICHLNANQFSRMYNCPTELEEYSALLPRVYKSSMEPLSITQKQPPEVYNFLFNKDADLKTGNFVKKRL